MILSILILFSHRFNISNLGGKNLYQILDVDRNANQKEIEKIYKKFLVDKKRTKEPSWKTLKFWSNFEFAYSTLSDPKSRKLYDKYGKDFITSTHFSIFGYKSNLHKKIFALQNPGASSSFNGILSYPVQFDLIDFFYGTKKTINILRTVACECPRGGSRCPKCRQNPFLTVPFTYTLELPRGAPYMHRIMARDILDSGIDRGSSDIMFVCYHTKDIEFDRDGFNLVKKVTVELSDVLKSGNITIKNIDGEDIEVSLDNVSHNDVREIKGKGLPNYLDQKTRGNLIIRFKIRYPKKLTKDQRDKLSALLSDDYVDL